MVTEDKSKWFMQLRKRIEERSAVVAVIGLGYVGLPVSLSFCRAGFSVIGVEIDHTRCDKLQQGKSSVPDVTNEELQAALDGKGLNLSTTIAAAQQADVVIICVPTPLRKSKEPDLTAIVETVHQLARVARAGQMVVLESTTYPGTTEEILQPALCGASRSIGHDFFLAFSPERIDPGNDRFPLRSIPKIVGGITVDCTTLVCALYGSIVDRIVPVSSPKVAEAAKLLENTFRSVNIGLANEMALICSHLGIDVWEVIDAAATKPFGFLPHYPGPGLGGHCIPLDPHYLTWKARIAGYDPRLIQVADDINSKMPLYVVRIVAETLAKQGKSLSESRILALGVAYKRDVSDTRESPALVIVERLLHEGALISYSDPFVPTLTVGEHHLRNAALTPDAVKAVDCVVILTDHSGFDYRLVGEHAPAIVDTRNALRRNGVDCSRAVPWVTL